MSLLVKIVSLAALVLVLIAFAKTWPLPLDPQLSHSLTLYRHYLSGAPVPVTRLLGPVDMVCMVGPYDSFLDPRFANQLNRAQISAAEHALTLHNARSLGDNRIFMVGLRGDEVSATYTSNFFANLSTEDKSSSSLDCVDGRGFISVETFRDVIVIKLITGVQ